MYLKCAPQWIVAHNHDVLYVGKYFVISLDTFNSLEHVKQRCKFKQGLVAQTWSSNYSGTFLRWVTNARLACAVDEC